MKKAPRSVVVTGAILAALPRIGASLSGAPAMDAPLSGPPAIGALIYGAPQGRDVRATLDRAVADFAAGQLEQAAAGFDRVAELAPEIAPQLWQRGIALYYVGRYDDCRSQFESHRTVNPNDVENAAWHYLCVAVAASAEEAERALLPVGPDPRTPMADIYEMFAGRLPPVAVLAAAGDSPRALFYAHLYIGLYHEARDEPEARSHIELAAADRFATAGGYMHMVARVHRDWLEGRR